MPLTYLHITQKECMVLKPDANVTYRWWFDEDGCYVNYFT